MRVKAKVERVLQVSEESRNSDKKLLLNLWALEGLGLSDTQMKIFLDKCTTPESITRARRSLKDKYPANEKVTEYRYKRFEQYRSGSWELGDEY
jgi:hypothetical protein